MFGILEGLFEWLHDIKKPLEMLFSFELARKLLRDTVAEICNINNSGACNGKVIGSDLITLIKCFG